MAVPVALLDANVLRPITLTDWLLRLAEIDLFRPLWSGAIHAEWMRTFGDRPDLTWERLDRRRQAMDRAFPHAVVTGYEPLVEGLTLPDPNDRHVLAAAIRGGATEIVTFDLGDFPADYLASYGIAPTHPDRFITRLLTAHPTAAPVVRALLAPPERLAERLAHLTQLGLPETAAVAAGL